MHSHVHALTQCRKLIRELGLKAVVPPTPPAPPPRSRRRAIRPQAAIASELAGEIYGLVSLRADIEDAEHNTTRFLIMAREP